MGTLGTKGAGKKEPYERDELKLEERRINRGLLRAIASWCTWHKAVESDQRLVQ
jgi:hypothetical protein